MSFDFEKLILIPRPPPPIERRHFDEALRDVHAGEIVIEKQQLCIVTDISDDEKNPGAEIVTLNFLEVDHYTDTDIVYSVRDVLSWTRRGKPEKQS
jgi:hypothetical protein